MTTKTSLTHPLQIARVDLNGAGVLGLTFCPGKKQPNSTSGHWDRDLGLDLDLIRSWGAVAVVTLMPQHELDAVGVGDIGAAVEQRGMEWYHLPIVDVDVPGDDFERRWLYAGLRLRAHLRQGRSVLIHCRGGLGRTGTVAGRLMVELGCSPANSIEKVRAVRPGAIETYEQERYVHRARLIDAAQDAAQIDDQSIAPGWEPCLRILEMAHELHIRGFQCIRLFPYFGAGGCWRLELTPASNLRNSTSSPTDEGFEAKVVTVARYSAADGWHPYGWESVEGVSIEQMAEHFFRQFPGIAEEGRGEDWAYAGWVTGLLGEVRKGLFPYFLADYSSHDLNRAIPMHPRGSFAPPPPLPANS